MKLIPSTALATWMLDRLGTRNQSLTGDLLEELNAGRSSTWYWRQTLSAIAITLSSRARAYLLPLLFSACWSLLYPTLWPAILHSAPAQNLLSNIATHDVPFSTALGFISGIAPVALFIALGLIVYLISHMTGTPSALRLLASLSISFNVVFVTIIGQHLHNTAVDLRILSRENLNAHLIALCLPLALGLYAALLCALPPSQRRRHSSLIV